MVEIEKLKARITNLPASEFARLREWFMEIDNEVWDGQIAADSKAGKFEALIARAKEIEFEKTPSSKE